MQIEIEKMIEEMNKLNASGMIYKQDCLAEKEHYQVKIEITKLPEPYRGE